MYVLHTQIIILSVHILVKLMHSTLRNAAKKFVSKTLNYTSMLSISPNTKISLLQTVNFVRNDFSRAMIMVMRAR